MRKGPMMIDHYLVKREKVGKDYYSEEANLMSAMESRSRAIVEKLRVAETTGKV